MRLNLGSVVFTSYWFFVLDALDDTCHAAGVSPIRYKQDLGDSTFTMNRAIQRGYNYLSGMDVIWSAHP